MSTQHVETSAPLVSSQPVTERPSGVKTVLRFTGIPPSWLNKRPKLPSRNWLIFLSFTSSMLGLYVYDRRQCKRIKQIYVDKVKELADEPLAILDSARKVTVYGAKWPGDEDYDQGLKYFRKFIKPILVAAAIDYEMVAGKRHGDIANRIANDVRIRRRFDLGLESDSELERAIPTYKTPAQRRERELEGGIILIGRPTFKEFMFGLKRGWTEGLEHIEQDELLSRVLEDDGHFDEPEETEEPDSQEFSPKLSSLRVPPQGVSVFSPTHIRSSAQMANENDSRTPDDVMNTPPIVPTLPPLLLVPFTNYIGLPQIPLMIWDFFNQRHKVLSGAQAGYRLARTNTRPICVPSSDVLDDVATQKSQRDLGDLEFDKEAESYYKSSVNSIPSDTATARKKYYEALPAKLVTARELARGIREPTKEEYNNPPPTEVELRAERMKKEQRWRNDLAGWDIVKPEADVTWDERFIDAVRIFTDPPIDSDIIIVDP